MEGLINGLLGFLNTALEAGFNTLGDKEKKEILFSLETLYVALETYGDRIAESTATPYDDTAVAELKEAVVNLATANGVQKVLDLQALYVN